MLRIDFLFSIIFIALDTEIKGGKSRNQSLQVTSSLFHTLIRAYFKLTLDICVKIFHPQFRFYSLRSTYLFITFINIVAL